MKLRFFLIAFILSLPFWWGINVLTDNLEDFWYSQEIIKRPEILTASANQMILEMEFRKTREQKIRKEYFGNLEIEAEAVISVQINNKGEENTLFEKNSQKPLLIASLTKLMTALVVFDLDETYNPFQLIKITKEAVSQEGQSKYGDLIVGEKLSVETLLHIMLIESSNDAAFALTEPIGEKAFVDLMNIYARDIGLENTFFVNPTGLEKNISTVKDLAKLAKYILVNHPQIFGITFKQSYEALKPDNSIHHFIPLNTNELLGEIPEIIIGGKTGETPISGQCFLLVTKTPENKGYLINIILGSKDRFGEMKKLINIII